MKNLELRDQRRISETSAGYTVEASAASIAFLWDNWDVLFKIGGGRIRAEQVTQDSWKGYGFWGSGEWFRTQRSATVNAGRFEFLTIGKLFGIGFRSQTVSEYRRIDDKTVAYFGKASYHVPSSLPPFRELMSVAAVRVVNYVNQVGANAATAITQDSSLVGRAAGDQARSLFEEYVAEEDALKRGSKGSFKHLAPGEDHAAEALEPEIAELRRDLRRLEGIVTRSHAPLDIQDYQASLDLYSHDPTMALVRNRNIVEQIAKHIFEAETGAAAGRRSLSEIIAQLATDSAQIPDSIIALMNTVISLANVAPSARRPDVLTTNDAFGMSFPATLGVTEWFVVDYLTTARPPQPRP